jgi:1-phosphofructokinase family hexose kinase
MSGAIVTLTPAPALDLTWHVDSLVPGQTHRAPRGLERAGGKGINVARIVHNAGRRTWAILPAGGPTGDRLATDLARSRVPHSIVRVRSETRRTVTIVDQTDGTATLIAESAGGLSPAEWATVTTSIEVRARDAAVLVVSGSVPVGAPAGLLTGLVATAREAGVPVIVDTSGEHLLAAARAGATLLKPNRAELVEATGETDLQRGVEHLLELGAAAVCVSLGAAGMVATSATNPTWWHARLGRVLRGNATGAGDAAVAALAIGLMDGRPLQDTLRDAVAWSASAVRMPLAGEISAEVGAFATEVTVTRSDLAVL